MVYNNLTLEYTGELLEDAHKLNYTIFEVYMINKYHSYYVSDENISKLLNIHLEDTQKVVGNYDLYLKDICEGWVKELQFIAGSFAPYDNLTYLNNNVVNNKSNLNITFFDIISIMTGYFKGKSMGEMSSIYLLSPKQVERLVYRYLFGDFDDIEIKFLKKNKLIDKLIDYGKEMKNEPEIIDVGYDDNIDKICTDVKVGKSYANKGWTLNRGDVSLLIPLLSYEEECDVVVDGIFSKGRLNITTRAYFRAKDKNIVEHLRKLNVEDENKRVDLEILLNHSNPFSEITPESNSAVYDDNESKYNKKIIADVKVGKASSSNGWTLPRNKFSAMVPILSYEEECDMIVDGIPFKGKLNIAPRMFFKGNKKLKEHLKDLYEDNPNHEVKIEILLNH